MVKCTIKTKAKRVNVGSQSPAEAKFRHYTALPQTPSATPCESVKGLELKMLLNGALCFMCTGGEKLCVSSQVIIAFTGNQYQRIIKNNNWEPREDGLYESLISLKFLLKAAEQLMRKHFHLKTEHTVRRGTDYGNEHKM